MMVVTVHTTQLHVLAIDLKDLANDFYLLHTKMIVECFVVLTVLRAKQLQGEGIKPRLLGSPKTRCTIIVIREFDDCCIACM